MTTGCIFCDIGLKPIKMKRQWIHYDRRQGIAVCTNTDKGIKPMLDPYKRGVVRTPNVKPNG